MVQLNFNNITKNYQLNETIAAQVIQQVIDSEQYEVAEISLILTDDEYLNEMKKNYFGEDVLSDTITFNINDETEPIEGEMYLSAERIEQNAAELNIPMEREFANVIIHSVLHLLGYEDYEDEKKQQMFALQEKYLSQLDYKNLLIKGK
jgi:rRNA maturation RNase YbeY